MKRLLFSLLLVAFAATAYGQGADRPTRIIENLKEQVPSLASLDVQVLGIEDSPYGGLDQGSLLIRTQNGPTEILFLIAEDDSEFYLINGQPLDVSEDPTLRQAARAALIATAAANRPVKGSIASGNVIAEFSDFQCPFCARAVTPVRQVAIQRPDVGVVYFHLPLDSIHPWARPAAVATECAFVQDNDAFWTLHDGLFEQQEQIDEASVVDIAEQILTDSGIDLAQWRACTTGEDAESHQAALRQIDQDVRLATQLGVQSTPTFFSNGVRFRGAVPAETLLSPLD